MQSTDDFKKQVVAEAMKMIDSAVADATRKLNEQLEEVRGQLKSSQKAEAASGIDLAMLRPLLRDSYRALVWATAHPDYLVGGKHHRGFLGTAAPVLTRLAPVYDPKRQATSLAGSAVAAGGVGAGGVGAGGAAAAGATVAGTAGTVGAGGGGVGDGSDEVAEG